MSDLRDSLAISASGMRAQATRLRHVAENMANADTPGYQRKLVTFETVSGLRDEAGQVRTGQIGRAHV